MFNWYAVNDNRKIAPIGWHVATDAEWTALTDYLGGLLVAGGKLKEVGTIHWLSPNVGATNEVDYTALPGGIIERNGEFRSVGLMASWWCSTESSATDAWGWGIFNDAIHVDRGDYYDKKIGFSVRCVKDATTSNNDHIFNNSIQIYPNPVIDRIFIKCSKIQVTEVKVYNLIGICVLREGINSGTTEISLVSLAAGSYIIELINADWAIQRKLIKK